MGKRAATGVRSSTMRATRAGTWFAAISAVVIAGCASTTPPPDPPAVEIEATSHDPEAVALPPPRSHEVSKPPRRRWPPANDARHAKKLAIEAYKVARRRYLEGEYADAALHFEKADFYVPGALPKYSLAECYDHLGHRSRAITAYQQFIDSNPSEKYDDRVARARKRIRELAAAR